MTKKTRTRRVISLLCALLMIITLLPMHVASAAATPYYLTLLAVAGGDGDYVVNCADVGTATLKQSDVFNFEGWVYSTVKFSSYTITFAKGNNPPSKTVEAKVENFPFPEDFKANVKANTKKTYTVENSKWSASVKLSDLSTGTWTVMVKGRVVGDANSTYDIAKVTLTIKATGTGPNNYAVCNDTPNPNAVKQYTKNGASKVTIPNHFVYGNTTSFNVSGWAIHDRGIDSYFYTIKNKSTGAVVSGKENKYISPLNRSDLGPTAKSLQIAAGNNTYHTWYNGSVSISGMAVGTYVAYIYGKTLDGQTFPVAEITFTIEGGSITAKEGSVTVTKISAPRNGVTKTLTIQANGDGGNWKVTSNQSWVKVTQDIKNKKLTIKVDASNLTKTRTATITLSCGGAKQSITVSQEPGYHKVTLYAEEGTIYGLKKYEFTVPHGTTVSAAISGKEKPVTRPGRAFVQYTDEKDPATRTKSEQYITQLYQRKIEKDINLYALYWVDLSKYESARISKTQDRVSEIWQQSIVTTFSSGQDFFSNLVTLGLENNIKKWSNTANNIAVQNKNAGEYSLNDNRLIYGQRYLKDYKIGNRTIDKAGCGVVACYNARTLLGCNTDLVDMITKVDDEGYMLLGGTGFSGFIGLNPAHVEETINYDGPKVKVEKYDKSTSFDEIVYNDLKNMRTGVVYIVCAWNGDHWTDGAHYICFEPKYDDKDGYLLYSYNRYSNWTERVRFNSVLELINDEEPAQKDRFIAGYRITRVSSNGGHGSGGNY